VSIEISCYVRIVVVTTKTVKTLTGPVERTSLNLVEKCGGVVVRHLKMQLAASSESTSKEMKTRKMKILTDNISE